jgi:hypothetical protein
MKSMLCDTQKITEIEFNFPARDLWPHDLENHLLKGFEARRTFDHPQ